MITTIMTVELQGQSDDGEVGGVAVWNGSEDGCAGGDDLPERADRDGAFLQVDGVRCRLR